MTASLASLPGLAESIRGVRAADVYEVLPDTGVVHVPRICTHDE